MEVGFIICQDKTVCFINMTDENVQRCWERGRQRSGIDTIKHHNWPRTPRGKVTKTQENITHKRAKRPALSRQVTTRLQSMTDTNINNKKVSTKEARPWNVSQKYYNRRTLTSFMVPISPGHPYFWCGSRLLDAWFAWKIPNLSIYHLLVNTN